MSQHVGRMMHVYKKNVRTLKEKAGNIGLR